MALEVIANGEKRRMPKHRMRGMELSALKSVDEYIAAQPEGVEQKLEQVRTAIRSAVPEATSAITYPNTVMWKVNVVFPRTQGTLFAICRIGDVLRDAQRLG